MLSTARSKTFKVYVRAATKVNLWESSISNELKIAFTLKKCRANVGPTQYLEENCWHYVGICKAYSFGLKTLD